MLIMTLLTHAKSYGTNHIITSHNTMQLKQDISGARCTSTDTIGNSSYVVSMMHSNQTLGSAMLLGMESKNALDPSFVTLKELVHRTSAANNSVAVKKKWGRVIMAFPGPETCLWAAFLAQV